MADIYSHLIFSRALLCLQVLSPVLLYDSQKILLHLVQDEISNQSKFHAGWFEGHTEIQSLMCRTQFLNKECPDLSGPLTLTLSPRGKGEFCRGALHSKIIESSRKR